VSHPESANAVEYEVEVLGRKAVSIRADSANPTDIQNAVAEVAEKPGVIDAAVVSAAILRHASVETFSLEDLDFMLDVDVRGVLLSILASVAQMRDGVWLITIRSNTAIRTGSPGNIVYAMTKAAVAAMVKGAALDRAHQRLTVNHVQTEPLVMDMTAATVSRLREVIWLKCIGHPSEIAAIVSYLAGLESSYMTGPA
jgi:3-oxoacyl-[acyl-carrier protein] reductase